MFHNQYCACVIYSSNRVRNMIPWISAYIYSQLSRPFQPHILNLLKGSAYFLSVLSATMWKKTNKFVLLHLLNPLSLQGLLLVSRKMQIIGIFWWLFRSIFSLFIERKFNSRRKWSIFRCWWWNSWNHTV